MTRVNLLSPTQPTSIGLKITNYTGDGAGSKIISLGLSPKFLEVYDYGVGKPHFSWWAYPDFVNSKYVISSISNANGLTHSLDETASAFVNVFPANFQIDVGVINGLGGDFGFINTLNDVYVIRGFS